MNADMDNKMENPIKRIVLVQPSAHEGVQSLFTFHKGKGLGPKPPQAIMILASYLLQEGYTDTHCLDAQLDDLSPQQTVDRLVKLNPDIIGFTIWTDFWYPAYETIRLTRERLPDCTIIIGGPHCTIFPRETLEACPADFLVAGDGETPLLALTHELMTGIRGHEMAGLWRKDQDQIIAPPASIASPPDMSHIPIPDRTLLPYQRYASILTPGSLETTMITSRGCPYKCVYCKIDVQKVYARPAAQVVEEFRRIQDLGISDIQIYDDTFTWGRQRVIDICNGIIENNIKVRWAIRDRANRADVELYRLMKRAGMYRIHFGVETGSPHILKNSGKFLTIEQVENAFQIARDEGLSILAYYMFGFLDETREDAAMTIDLAKRMNADYSVFTVLNPYPGTSIYREGLDRGIIPRDFWSDFAKNPTPDYRIPYLIEDKMSREQLISLKNHAQLQFYITPRRILKEIRDLTSGREFFHKLTMAKNIVFDSIPGNFR